MTCQGAISQGRSAHAEWFSASELADMELPGLPADKRSIARRAQDERWSTRQASDGSMLLRPRKGRGGGVEFHYSLLPAEAQIELAKRGAIADPDATIETDANAASWRWYEEQSKKTRRTAEKRLSIVNRIETIERSGATRTAAIASVSASEGTGKSTLWNWMRMVDGIDPANRLPALAPRRKGGGSSAEIPDELWIVFKSDWLRPSAPTLTSCYERTAAIARAKGLSMPSERTF